MRAPIHAVKHYVQTSLTGVLGSAILNNAFVSTKEVTAATAVNNVVEGCIIKAVYIELWVLTQETAAGSFIFVVEKRPGVGSPVVMNVTDMAALGDYENKKNVLYTTQGLVGDQDTNPMVLFKGWLKIPKSKQRFGLADQLSWSLFAQGGIDLQICGFVTYKEYR